MKETTIAGIRVTRRRFKSLDCNYPYEWDNDRMDFFWYKNQKELDEFLNEPLTDEERGEYLRLELIDCNREVVRLSELPYSRFGNLDQDRVNYLQRKIELIEFQLKIMSNDKH